jgi:steroid delta-isomerase-like uncharacterized protein
MDCISVIDGLHRVNEGENQMSEENKAIVRHIIEDFNEGELNSVVELSAPDFIYHGAPPGVPPTREGWKQLLAMFRAGFPDLRFHIEHLIAEGDLAMVRFTGYGTHQGEIMGIPATGREVAFSGVVILRFANGKMVERWEEFDMLGMMMQLGAIPAPA